jgi:translation initiation factor 1
MAAKFKTDKNGLAYSTDPKTVFDYTADDKQATDANKQSLRIHLERQKGNRETTRIAGWAGSDLELQLLGKTLKTKCGVGGNVKDGEILLQGNHRDKVLAWLKEAGYTNTKLAGG